MPDFSRFRQRVVLLAAVLSPLATLRAQAPHARLADSVQALAERGLSTLSVAPINDALALLDHALKDSPTDSVLLHYRGYAWYRKGSVLFSHRRTQDAKVALDSAESTLTRAGRTLAWPENSALLGATLGQKIAIGVSPFTAMRLGRRSNAALDAAAGLGPRNPRVFLIRGIGTLFKPKLFGGGVDKASAELERALSLFQGDTAHGPYPSWGRGEVYQWIGMTRARQGRVGEARAAYLHVLEVDPGNLFVRDSLLPALQKDPR